MSDFTIKHEAVDVVVVGNLNPAIFSPDWLLRHGLIRDEDLEQVDLDVIHPEVSRFSLAWCQIEVLANRFVIRATEPGYFGAARDLAVGTFSVLSETPINAVGINVTYQTHAHDREKFDRLGHILAPKQPWEGILPSSPSHGLRQLNMQSDRPDNIPGAWNTVIQPLTLEDGYGLEVQLNCHFAYRKIMEEEPDITVGDIILAYWDESLETAEQLNSKLLNLVEES